MYQGVHGATCRSQEKIILPRPEGPRSRDRSAATYRMRQRKQKEWKGGSQAEGTNSKIRGWQESIAMQHAWRWSLEKGPPEMMLGSQARVFSHGIGAARGRGGDTCPSKQFPEQLPSHSARARRGPKDACLHKACSRGTASMGGPSGTSQVLFLLQCTCQDAGWWKRTATQPGA